MEIGQGRDITTIVQEHPITEPIVNLNPGTSFELPPELVAGLPNIPGNAIEIVNILPGVIPTNDLKQIEIRSFSLISHLPDFLLLPIAAIHAKPCHFPFFIAYCFTKLSCEGSRTLALFTFLIVFFVSNRLYDGRPEKKVPG
jgi:hypothetical protein